MPDLLPYIGNGLVGGVIGLITGMIIFRLQQKNKIMEYQTLSMPLVALDPTEESPISVSVRVSNFTGLEKDNETFTHVNSAYGFVIILENVGNDVITDSSIEIELDNKARIIDCDINPRSSQTYTIDILRDYSRPNSLTIVPQYVNRHQQIVAQITSADNSDSTCQVNIVGPGLASREVKEPMELYLLAMRLSIFVALPILFIIFAGYKFFPQEMLAVFGGDVITDPRVVAPGWMVVVSLSILGVGMTVFPYRIYRRAQRYSRMFVGKWDWTNPSE
jgi:hypothetical protein